MENSTLPHMNLDRHKNHYKTISSTVTISWLYFLSANRKYNRIIVVKIVYSVLVRWIFITLAHPTLTYSFRPIFHTIVNSNYMNIYYNITYSFIFIKVLLVWKKITYCLHPLKKFELISGGWAQTITCQLLLQV